MGKRELGQLLCPLKISLRVDADDGEEAAALGAFFAVTEEEVAAAGGTEIADEDVWGAEAGCEELGAIGFAKVEQNVFGRGLVAGGHHVHPLDGIRLIAGAEFVEPFGGFGKLRLKLGGNFSADFVAAAADGRADGGKEAGGLAAELHLHLADGFDNDALEGAAPTGMDGSDGARFRVDEEDRDAISGLYSEKQTGTVRGRSIAATGFGGRGVEDMDYVGVDLFQRDELEIGCAEGGLEPVAVFDDVFFGVPFGETEVKHLFTVEGADAAGFGAEAVDEPGEFY